jgi:signal transduction histidine kinase
VEKDDYMLNQIAIKETTITTQDEHIQILKRDSDKRNEQLQYLKSENKRKDDMISGETCLFQEHKVRKEKEIKDLKKKLLALSEQSQKFQDYSKNEYAKLQAVF